MPYDQLGTLGEDLAVDYLKKRQYVILKRNFRNKLAEVDIIAEKDKTLCFIEVKTRTSQDYGHPLESITLAKQRKIILAARIYLANQRLEEVMVRFDVVTIDFKNPKDYKLDHFESAFEAAD